MDEKKDLVWTWQMLRQIFWDVQPLGNESLGRVRCMDWEKWGYGEYLNQKETE